MPSATHQVHQHLTDALPPVRGDRLRSCAFAAAAVGLALGAHATAGAALPGLAPLLLLGALVEAAVSALVRRRPGPLTTAAAMVSSQVALHGAFVLSVPVHEPAAAGVPAPMVLWHGAAALVLAGALTRGETLLARVACLLLPLLVIVPFRLPAVRARVVHLRPSPAPMPRFATLAHDLSRRGPPVPAVAVCA